MTHPINLPSCEEDIERTTQSIKAMAHPLRLKILFTLESDEITVNDIKVIDEKLWNIDL